MINYDKNTVAPSVVIHVRCQFMLKTHPPRVQSVQTVFYHVAAAAVIRGNVNETDSQTF